MNSNSIIKSISYDQEEIISNILLLHCKGGVIDLDPTYSIGGFYTGRVPQPYHKLDIDPKIEGVKKSNANNLPFGDSTVGNIMFDPPFIVGGSGKISKRFGTYKSIKELWKWYDECLLEFYRVMKKNHILIIKCQDTVSGGKQYYSHTYIMNTSEEVGFYCKDLFILLAKSRMIGHNHTNQKHARKYHSYFLVLEKV